MKASLARSGILVAFLCNASQAEKPTADVDVVLETSIGEIEIAIYIERAPASARAFLALIDDGSFAQNGAFYRAVRKNENDRGNPAIDVIQGGLQDPPRPVPAIKHESTRDTGLRHLNGTVSLARIAVGTATGGAFFICIGDQPALDAGGRRNSDGQGFAAFGRVTKGMEIVRRIHQLPTGAVASDPYLKGQMLDPPVRFLKAYRKVHAASDAWREAGAKFRDCPDCPEMTVVPPGRFTVTAKPASDVQDDLLTDFIKAPKSPKPAYEASIAKPFAVATYHVTRDEYAVFVRATGRASGEGMPCLDRRSGPTVLTGAGKIPRTSRFSASAARPRDQSSEPGVGRRYHLCLSLCGDGLGEPTHPRLAALELALGRLLHRGARRGDRTLRGAGDLQHRM